MSYPPPPPPGQGGGYPPPPGGGDYPPQGGGGGYPPPGGGGGYPPPPGGGGYAAQQTNQKALWSMILGILSITCCGIFAGIPALILGNLAKKDIAQSGGKQKGAGMAKAGVILGIISVVLSIIYIILVAAGALNFDAFDTTSSA